MTDDFYAVIHGIPSPSQRPRTRLVPSGNFASLKARARAAKNMGHILSLMRAQIYQPSQGVHRLWQQKIRAHLEDMIHHDRLPMPLFPSDIPVEVLLLFVSPLAKADHRKRSTPPRKWQISQRAGDFDNLAKVPLDAANGILFEDDRQVCRAIVEKIVGQQGEGPRLEMLVRPAQGDPDSHTIFETVLAKAMSVPAEARSRSEVQDAIDQGRQERLRFNAGPGGNPRPGDQSLAQGAEIGAAGTECGDLQF